MKVLQINATYGVGSTGLIMRDIGNALTSSGHEAYFAYQTAVAPPEKGYRVGSAFDRKRHALLCRIFGGQGFYSRRATGKLCRYIDEVSPDVVHLHNLHSNYVHLTKLLAYLAERDIPTVITMHDCWFFTGKCFHYVDVGCERYRSACGNCPKKKEAPASLIFDRSSRDLDRKISALKAIPRLYLVGCSDWICGEARGSRLAGCDIRRIYNGVDVSVFSPTDGAQTRVAYSLGEKKVILGMANKWLSDANGQLVRDVCASLPHDRVLCIIGCTEEQKKRLEPYGDRVRAIGYVSDRLELARLYAAADVFVNPTRADTLPTVNMESICAGTPVVTYDVGGSPELIDPQTGAVVPEGDVSGMIHAIDTVLAEEMIDCARTGKERFDKTKCYEQYIDLYRMICTDREGA